MKPHRILHVLCDLSIGGAQSLVLNLYRQIDRSKTQFDFILDHPHRNMVFEKEVLDKGGRVFYFEAFNGKNLFYIIKQWNLFFQQHKEYRILHSHIWSYASLYIPIAKKNGLITIVHSHSSSNGSGLKAFIKTILQYPLRYQVDYYLGCSMMACEWLFGKQIVRTNRWYILKNGIDVSKYSFDEEIRNKIRGQLSITDNMVYGHIGRFTDAKNHLFLLDIFYAIKQSNPLAKLCLVGDGELKAEILLRINQLKLNNDVILIGETVNPEFYLQAFDCFLFPSKWEGLPISVVEAQAAGLPCYISDTVSKEIGITKLIHYLPIDKGVTVWSENVISKQIQRGTYVTEIVDAGFDIKESADNLVVLYDRIYDHCR